MNKAKQLKGTKVLGKTSFTNDLTGATKKRKKRKRKKDRDETKPAAASTAKKDDDKKSAKNKTRKKPKGKATGGKTEVDEIDVDRMMRETMQNIQGNSNVGNKRGKRRRQRKEEREEELQQLQEMEEMEAGVIEVTEFIETGVTTKILETQSWPSRIEPEILSITHSRPKHLSIRDIIKYKNFQTDKISTPIKYDIALWSKLTYPLLVIAIALSGLPFIFGLVRSGGFGQRLLIGMMLGMILYYLNRILLNMGEVFHVYPVFVTALPASIILLLVLLYLKKDKIS
jgi:lipopolysaccharide export LptBFGC system permease protein LptF